MDVTIVRDCETQKTQNLPWADSEALSRTKLQENGIAALVSAQK